MHLIYRGRVRMKWRRSPAVTAAGYTLIEFMVAITLSLLVLASLTAIFISSMRARDEVERANQQVESGRYAAQLLMDDLQMAGYYGEFDIALAGITTPATKPDPCMTGSNLPGLRSEERRVGQACVRMCRYRLSPSN